MPRIFGIDPGSRATGFGLVESSGSSSVCVASGVVRAGEPALEDRLFRIHRAMSALLEEHRPDLVAVETAFYHKNPRSTLVLGHVRGVILLAARQAELPVFEYAPRDVKLAVTGSGAASKDRVAFMVRGLLGLKGEIALDATDALAVALCHRHRSRLPAVRPA